MLAIWRALRLIFSGQLLLDLAEAGMCVRMRIGWCRVMLCGLEEDLSFVMRLRVRREIGALLSAEHLAKDL